MGQARPRTAVMYRYNASGVPTGMYVWLLDYSSGGCTASPVPEFEDLLTYHGFSIRITGVSGIRFKTGISPATRAQLTGDGLAGYRLTEYGTLVMTAANQEFYPFVKDGQKVASGRAYWTENGTVQDKVFETAGGRYRFTSVLVNLPVSQYKTEFAFRGYIQLQKDGEQITLYGPPVARSIYTVAQQILQIGEFAPGSSADLFIRRLISDADSL